MARIRTIKPEIWTDERLTECSVSARLLFIGMLNFSDDNGNQPYSAKRLKMQVFPADSIDTQPLIEELITHGVVSEYSVSGEKYLHIKGFKKHQVINRPSKTSIPEPSLIEDSVSTPVPVTDGREGKGKEEEQEQSSSSAAPNDPKTDVSEISVRNAQRLATVTADALTTFTESSLVKANGGQLAGVSLKVGREKRQDQVRRCLRTARAICQENYNSPTITREFWVEYWAAVALDDFYSGRQPGGKGHENYVPDFELLTREATMLKIYDRASEDAA